MDDDFDHLVGLTVTLVEAAYQVIPKIDAHSASAIVRGDALVDSGYKPNTLQGSQEDDWVIEKMIGLVRELGRSQSTVPKLEGMVDALECYVAVSADAPGEMAAERMAIYCALVDAVRLLSSELLNAAVERHEVAEFARRSELQM